MRVNHELRHGAGRLLRKPLARRVDNDFRRVRLRIDADAERHIGNIEHTIIAADERMQIGLGGAPRLVRRILKGMVDRPWVVARIRGILRRLGLRSQRLTRGHAKAGERDPLVRHLHRNAEGADPCVGAMFDPILVRQHAEAARAPELTPRVLDDEADGVIADERKGVSAPGLGILGRSDDRQRIVRSRHPPLSRSNEAIPSVVDICGYVDRADVVERRLQIDDGAFVHAVVDAERTCGRVALPIRLWRLKHRRVGPHRLRAHAMLVPALERAATARSFVVDAWPFVVSPRKLVDHSRADGDELLFGLGLDVADPPQIVGDASQTEAGAGALVTLIAHQAGLDVATQILRNDFVRRPPGLE